MKDKNDLICKTIVALGAGAYIIMTFPQVCHDDCEKKIGLHLPENNLRYTPSQSLFSSTSETSSTPVGTANISYFMGNKSRLV